MSSGSGMRCGIVIPTLNGAGWLRLQRLPPERAADVLVIDSSSCDATVPLALSLGWQVRVIARTAFDHGATRQLGVEWAVERGYACVVFLTQDALALGDGAIDRLLSAFAEPTIAAACGRQLPRLAAGPIEAHARLFNYPAVSRANDAGDLAVKGLLAAFMSNSFAAYRVSALQTIGGFEANCIFGEDMLAALQLLQNGWRTAYVADAVTVHSHDYSALQEFRRYFDVGVLHDRLYREFAHLPAIEGEGGRFVRSELSFLARRAPWLLPSAWGRTALKYLGYRLGKAQRRLPLACRRWCSMQRGFWTRRPAAVPVRLEQPAVEVLLAVHNGATWLAQLLDSLQYQTYANFLIIAFDDGSTDGSAEVIRRHRLFVDGRVRLLEHPVNRGQRATMNELLRHSTALYVLFADQDDWWLADKVERFVAAAQVAQARHGAGTPLLVHSDLTVVGRDLQALHRSLRVYQGLDPVHAERFGGLLMQNVVTGCALLVNRALLARIGFEIPGAAVMHDYYLALAAAVFGKIEYLPVPTVLYRQHGGNTLGAKAHGMAAWRASGWRATQEKIRVSLLDRSGQADDFLSRWGVQLHEHQRAACRALAELPRQGWWRRRYAIVRHGLWKVGLVRNVVLLVMV
ncbi:MAG: glycosyltransferase family 2 protein [Burkholderiaceae bacterium]